MYKVIRDPIYSEVKLNPLELLIIDTPLFQRLRDISQLVGTSWVFPASTHNRFSHSLGVLYISSLYSAHLFKNDVFKQVVIRLAGLLHDIAHGPFSHQFDDTIYKSLNIFKGHDEFRKKVIIEFLPVFIIKKLITNLDLFDKVKDFIYSFNFAREFQNFEISEFNSNLKDLSYGFSDGILGNDSKLKQELFNVIKGIFYILKKVLEVYSLDVSLERNIIQGPFGADRLDFIRRDAYFSGTTGFSTGSFDRIIFNTKIINNKLAYHIKTFDEIFSVLFGRFMMYKNVYFHKTSRAIDLLIQEILKNSIDIFRSINLSYKKILADLDLFVNLTDDFILNTIYNLYLFNNKKTENRRIKEKLGYCYYLISCLKDRRVFKLILEKYVYKKINLEKLKSNFKRFLIKNKEKKYIINELLINFDKIFIFDLSEEIKLFDAKDIDKYDIFLYNEFNELISFSDFVKNNPIYDIKTKKVKIFRIYLNDFVFNEGIIKVNYLEAVKFLRRFVWENKKELDGIFR
jgi:HD superfamily phosphohydrolase